jgi:hypothetical protein
VPGVPFDGRRLRYGPRPTGAFSSSGVLSTFRKHQITNPHTKAREMIIVIQPPVVMGESSL